MTEAYDIVGAGMKSKENMREELSPYGDVADYFVIFRDKLRVFITGQRAYLRENNETFIIGNVLIGDAHGFTEEYQFDKGTLVGIESVETPGMIRLYADQ